MSILKSKYRNSIIIFISFFLIRLIFSIVIGFLNNYQLEPDSIDLIRFSDKAISGNFNFDYGRFIASPGFPIFAAFHKMVFGRFWNYMLVFSQIILSSLSGIYLYGIANLIFNDRKVAIISTIIYGLFPLTFWYVNTFCQETLFQSLFIISIYHLIATCKGQNLKSLFLSSLFFSFAYLTKSHILIFSLFVPLILYFNLKSLKTVICYSIIFASICLCFSLPYGLYNKRKSDIYVLSSNGAGFQFYLGNTNAGYVSLVDVPLKSSNDYRKIKDITTTAGFFNGNQNKFDSILKLPQSTKQSLFFKEGCKWLRQNPQKAIKMKIYDIGLFLMPGVSFRHYEFKQWILALILSFPIYLLAYIGIIISLKRNVNKHFYMLSIFLSMLLFSTVFYVQNRFRTITIEPFFIIYASYSINLFFLKYVKKIKLLININFFSSIF